ncbi:MAG TPA: energy transducer TonB [Allosphingosinicella sp.]|nr:energy transducer TonB [Allosphingosinicella sp.]
MILTMIMTMAAALALQADQATPPRRARANLNQYFSTDDYPPTAAARGAQGTTGFWLSIGADGTVTRCTISHSSGDAALDAATCAILLGRARYEPARDAAGRAIPGKDWGRVTWRLPPPAPGGPFVRSVTISRLRSNGAGQLDCTVTTDGVAETDAGPTHCGALAGTGANEMLRRAQAPMEVTMVSVGGPADTGVETAGEDEARYGALQYDIVSDLVIGQNGRITQCSIVTRTIPPSSLFEDVPGLCELPPPGAPPLFEPATDPAPRHARYRYALYIKGRLVDWQTPGGPAVTPGPPPRP